MIDDFLDDPGTKTDPSSPGIVLANPHLINSQIAQERIEWPELSSAARNDPALKLYNLCKDAGTNNVLGPRLPIDTCNKIESWQALSTGHPDDWWLIQCIRYGFPLQYRGPSLRHQFQGNHSLETVNWELWPARMLSPHFTHGVIYLQFLHGRKPVKALDASYKTYPSLKKKILIYTFLGILSLESTSHTLSLA